jgi:hypothetical protein
MIEMRKHAISRSLGQGGLSASWLDMRVAEGREGDSPDQAGSMLKTGRTGRPPISVSSFEFRVR